MPYKRIDDRVKWLRLFRRNQRLKCLEYLGGKCVDCGETDHSRLEFDHIDPSQKTANVASLYGRRWAVIQAELDKCEIRCLDCHTVKDGRLDRDRWGQLKREGKSSRAGNNEFEDGWESKESNL